MGYATTVYAVELDAVRAAVGGNDAGLRERVLAAIGTADGPPPKEVWAVVTLDGIILFHGRPVSPDVFAAELKDPKWAGTTLCCHQRVPKTADEGRRRAAGRFAGSVAFSRFVRDALAAATAAGTRWAGLSWHNDEEAGAGELALDLAATELIAGTFTDEESAHQYAYALEQVCGVLGTRLGVIEGKGRLKPLKLNTPLSADRPPVPGLPENDDFPYLSHLTAAEVTAEAARLRGMDLAFPADAPIEAARRQYAALLAAAADQGRAVVTFYY